MNGKTKNLLKTILLIKRMAETASRYLQHSLRLLKFSFPWEMVSLFMFNNTGEKSKHVRKHALDINYGQAGKSSG